MQLNIFDVDHGFAALARDGAGVSILFDCGHNQISGFRPSTYLASRREGVSRLVVSHPDEDHLTDLPRLLGAGIRPTIVHRNMSLDAATIARLKLAEGPLTPGVGRYLALIEEFNVPESQVSGAPYHPSMRYEAFFNPYPSFTDTNNLSLVSFLAFGCHRVIIPGDLEIAGWRSLLLDPVFRDRLRGVTTFVASHHGRESGYCPEVFEVCHPEIVVISDGPIRHDTQEVSYARHASGVPWSDGTRRYVLTTRSDGHILLGHQPDGRGWIWTDSLA